MLTAPAGQGACRGLQSGRCSSRPRPAAAGAARTARRRPGSSRLPLVVVALAQPPSQGGASPSASTPSSAGSSTATGATSAPQAPTSPDSPPASRPGSPAGPLAPATPPPARAGSPLPAKPRLLAERSRVAAVAAKISAARELARRLAEEKAAAVAATRADVDSERLKRSTEEAAAAAAAQAARADALARQLKRIEGSRSSSAGSLARLKRENEALKGLLLEMAADRQAAQARLSDLQARMADLAAGGASPGSLASGAGGDDALEAVLGTITAAAPPPPVLEAPPAAPPALAPPPEAEAPKAIAAPADAAEAAAAAAAEAAAALVAPPAVFEVPPPPEAEAEAAEAAETAAPPPPPAAPAAPAGPPPPTAEEVEVARMAAAAAAAAEEARAAEQLAEAEAAAAAAAAAAIAATAGAQPAAAPPSPAQLATAAVAAAGKKQPVFVWPLAGVPVGGVARVYYNRAAGPLRGGPGGLQLKAGLNKWEEIAVHDMQRCDALSDAPGDAEWWEAEFTLPAALFKADFVVLEPQRGSVDNNAAKDFSLPLVGGPTETQLLEQRATEYAAAEAVRRALLASSEVALWEHVQLAAAEAAAEARVAFRERRTKELMAAASQAVAQRRRPALATLETAIKMPGTFAWVGGPLKAGTRCTLAYNCRSGPLAFTNSAKLHLGYDGWYNKEKQTYDMAPLDGAACEQHKLPAKEASWCAATVDVPASAAVVDFVISDRDGRVWDNNGGKDFHSPVEAAAASDSMVEMVFQAMKREAAEADAAAEDRAASRAMRRVESKAHVSRRRREAQQEFLYTIPVTPVAGQELELFYNPDLTPLRGRPAIYVQGGFNRWRHGSTIPPTLMVPSMPGGVGFLKATIQVPADAHVLDVVFGDGEAFFDNNGGLDYHVPVTGGSGAMPGLKVVHIAVEMAPIAKVGGMGDVVTALARAVRDEGNTVEVVIPKYDCIQYNQVEGLYQDGGFTWGGCFTRVWRGVVEGLDTTFLEPENGHFWRGCIYGRGDDHVRFGFFCGAAAEYLRVRGVNPDVLHCHDWQSAPVAFGERPGGAKVVFTIHNLNYGADLVGKAMAAAEVATTVSPTYAREISGHPAIAPFLNKMFGIRNGIDQDLWDPASDDYIPSHYGPEDVMRGKAAARAELRRRGNLAEIDVPLVSVVTRLVHQKGIHLIKHAAWRTCERGGQFVLLGSAPDPKIQGEFNALRDQLMRAYPDRAALFFSYDEPLSHLIYAASDMFLVPSMFEPCGLTQMVAMRYGTVPVVRKTGGLADTVFDVDHDEERGGDMGLAPNGFSFEGTDAAGLDYALNRALSMWYSDREGWAALAASVMQQDWSWDGPALDYLELYWRAVKNA